MQERRCELFSPKSGFGRIEFVCRKEAMRSACLAILALCLGCALQPEDDWSNYSRTLREGETVLVGRIESLREWCQVGEKMACYALTLGTGESYPVIFEPKVPIKVFPGVYDVTGHYVPTADNRFDRALSIRLWSLVK